MAYCVARDSSHFCGRAQNDNKQHVLKPIMNCRTRLAARRLGIWL